MHPSELKYLQVAQQLVAISVQMNNAYNSEQASLELHRALVPERLSTASGTQVSREAIAKLSVLTEQHKEAFNQLMMSATQQLFSLICEMPKELQELTNDTFARKVNETIDLLAQQYADRQEWAQLAEQMCEFVDKNRDSIDFQADTVLFHTDEALDQFNDLIIRLDSIAEKEKARYELRLSQIKNAMAQLSNALTA